MSNEQALEQSLADRIANQFEEPQVAEQPQEEAETPASEEAAQPEVVEVEFGGKSYQVPPELKDALMAQSDYTKKTTEVAEQKRLVEVKRQQLELAESERKFQAAVNDDIVAMQRIDFQIEQYKNIDATGFTSEQLWQLSRTIDKLKSDREDLSKKVTSKYGEWQQEQTKIAQDMLAKAQEAASKAIPNWSEQTQKQISDYAVSQGFDPAELKGITDPRVVKVLWQASQFAKLQASKLTGKVTTTPNAKPGSSNQMPQAVKDQFAFKKQIKAAPTSSAKARVIEQELMKRFN